MNYSLEATERAVNDGASWMDENHPGWATLVDLQILEMEHCTRCVLGQAVKYQSYSQTIEDAADDSGTDSNDWGIDHGFDAEMRDVTTSQWFEGDTGGFSQMAYERYETLKSLWVKEIQKRLV